MKINKRLQAICDLIPENSQVIDVGADHALVDIYLNKIKKCDCLATDISKEAINRAQKNIEKANAKVKTQVLDGLPDLNDEIIIISGMGAKTIINILKHKITNDLILSPNNNTHLVRKAMRKKGYHIEKELVIKEKRYYVITYYKYGKGLKCDDIVSPFLINNIPYMRKLLNYYQVKSMNEKNKIKKFKYKQIVRKIKKKVK